MAERDKALLADVLAMLEQLEPHSICGVGRIGYGHADDCEYAVLLTRLRKAVTNV